MSDLQKMTNAQYEINKKVAKDAGLPFEETPFEQLVATETGGAADVISVVTGRG
jgi:hypothetical protein